PKSEIRNQVVPLVATIHDLTPLALPELFASPEHDAFRESYKHRLEHLKRHADHLLADSIATKMDIIRFLDFPAERITVVPCGVGRAFRRANPQDPLYEWPPPPPPMRLPEN